ncbi:DNA primase DnaG [Salinirubellus sp. GCM10025818]|uniref:DNA primase DnaG n=1 Tax=Salinirubellus TaxID=2162630 RepID=UPI0030D45BE8
MHDTAKYLIHADITADGVVERNDVVGAVFGQTEGLLGDELEIRDLQESSKVGRIDVEIASEGGQSFGELTIATSLDKVETAILAAALETIDRIGPCRSMVEVRNIEDVRSARRREVVDRAKRLLQESFDGAVMTSDELIDEVRQSIRVEDITEYEGYPAGPRVDESDAVIVVEGRADVLKLLKYGVKNAVAVEGTDVPEVVADLTREKTVTAFLDGDRGGDLILKELAQVGDIDFVATAPEGRSVEDLDRHEVMAALREKVTHEEFIQRRDTETAEGFAATDGSAVPAPSEDSSVENRETPDTTVDPGGPSTDDDPKEVTDGAETNGSATGEGAEPSGEQSGEGSAEEATGPTSSSSDGDQAEEPETLRGHVRAVVEGGSGRARLLDAEMVALAEVDADEAFDLVRDAERVPSVLVLDGELGQRVLDVCAQRGVEQVVARSEGDFVKKPTGVRVRTADRLLEPADAD